MKAYEIRAMLIMCNVKVKDIAYALNISVPAVSQVISNKRQTSRIRKAISNAIHKPVDEIWPPKK